MGAEMQLTWKGAWGLFANLSVSCGAGWRAVGKAHVDERRGLGQPGAGLDSREGARLCPIPRVTRTPTPRAPFRRGPPGLGLLGPLSAAVVVHSGNQLSGPTGCAITEGEADSFSLPAQEDSAGADTPTATGITTTEAASRPAEGATTEGGIAREQPPAPGHHFDFTHSGRRHSSVSTTDGIWYLLDSYDGSSARGWDESGEGSEKGSHTCWRRTLVEGEHFARHRYHQDLV